MKEMDFFAELHSDMLSCIDAMCEYDVSDIMDSVESRVSFSIGYLGKNYKDLGYFLRFILKGDKKEIPF